MNENDNNSNDLSQTPNARKIQVFVSILVIAILAPLVLYSNCGTLQDGIQSELNNENELGEGIHQKVFIDIAGEKINEEESLQADHSEKVQPEKNK
ncbi:MAG: hypothetical protein IT286_05080 [Proteobacteria bacterium]|jgi:hypothetical protein|nr:hypothetical protein [Pseudomonadota bacterium]